MLIAGCTFHFDLMTRTYKPSEGAAGEVEEIIEGSDQFCNLFISLIIARSYNRRVETVFQQEFVDVLSRLRLGVYHSFYFIYLFAHVGNVFR